MEDCISLFQLFRFLISLFRLEHYEIEEEIEKGQCWVCTSMYKFSVCLYWFLHHAHERWLLEVFGSKFFFIN